MKGFTKTGQPIQGRKYTLRQGDIEIPVTLVVKLWGHGGSGDLVGIGLEDEEGNREIFPWPLESSSDEPIEFVAGWPE